MTDLPSLPSLSKRANLAAWILQCVVALAFFAAAGAKIASVPMLVDIFTQIGIGQWFRYVTAAVEIAGAITLLTPRFAAFGALLLAGTMFFAVLTHLFILQSSPAAAAVLCALSLVLLWLRRRQLLAARALLR